jgi:hypothetical protein
MTKNLSWLLFGACLAGCGAAPVGELSAELSAVNPGNLMSDADLTGGQATTVSQVQRFLQAKGSALANYSEHGESAAALIVGLSRASAINPVSVLARIETESGLIESGNLNFLSSATGCACPDSGVCDPSLAGFGKQVACNVKLMRGYLTDLAQKGFTVSGWRVGAAKTTLDGCAVTPANAATAALYTYTPWVGAYSSQSCGNRNVGGSSLMAAEYQKYAPSFAGDGGNGRCSQTEMFNSQFQGRFYWTCDLNHDGNAYICNAAGDKETLLCSHGCQGAGVGADDHCTPPPPKCSSSESFNSAYRGGFFWTCDLNHDGNAYVCAANGDKQTRRCANGCKSGGVGTDDLCT